MQVALQSLLLIRIRIAYSLDSQVVSLLGQRLYRGKISAIDYYMAAHSTSKNTSLSFSKND
jgi:hypothetical protein